MDSEIDMKIDIEKIQSHVRKEVEKEQKYWRENDAKFRAIEQRVPTYEDFRQMVLGSHLKPLDKGESLRDERGQISTKKVWNAMAEGAENNANVSLSEVETYQQMVMTIKPKNSLEFVKVWTLLEAKCDDETQMSFLSSLGLDEMKRIFKPEINGDMLGKFLVLFERVLSGDEVTKEKCDFVGDLLKVFTECNRFELNLMFLKDSECKSAKKIIELLENSYEPKFQCVFNTDLLRSLKSNYK